MIEVFCLCFVTAMKSYTYSLPLLYTMFKMSKLFFIRRKKGELV